MTPDAPTGTAPTAPNAEGPNAEVSNAEPARTSAPEPASGAIPAGDGSPTRVVYAGRTHPGRVRSINQDSYYAGELPGGGVLLAVADGMGGHKTGEVASQKAIDTIVANLGRSRAHPPAAIARAVQAANLEILEYAQTNESHAGMGTTLTAVFLDDQIALVAHVGDSRAYRLRGGSLTQLTFDHSWVAERVRQGVLTEEEAKRHRWRNVITNALGTTPEFRLDLTHFEVQAGDRILVCSDGVSSLLAESVLARHLANDDPDDAVRRLIDDANERGAPDNVTAVVLHALHVQPNAKRYELPERPSLEPEQVRIGETMSGIRHIESRYPLQDLLSKWRRNPYYPYRFWFLGCLYLLLLFVIFTAQSL